jgi:hypothetical protein
MTEIACKLYTKDLMDAMARLKDIPMSKVVRNAARDFSKAAFRATPTAQVSRSEFYVFTDRQGRRRYLHEFQVAGRKRKSMRSLRKVRIAKGWSRASWIGVFRALGMQPPAKPVRIPQTVEGISSATALGDDTMSTVRLTDYVRFDRFGRGSDSTTSEILRAGFDRAAQNLTREVTRMMQKEWRKG